MNLRIVTPEGITYENKIDAITLPTKVGEITVLQNHIALVSALVPGEIVIKKDEKEEYLSVSTGFIEVKEDNITLLADTAEMVESLVEEKILEAKERAEKLLEEGRHKSDVSFAEAAAMLERELARLKVYRRRRQKT